MKVLIADDQAAIRVILKANLKKWNYDVCDVSDGKLAWDEIIANPPDIAILDWEMPEMDGIELCRQIRARKKLPFIYIIMITGKTDTSEIVAGLEAGADDYIAKPCPRDVLRSRVAVGARTVKYEKELATRNVRLQEYSSEMEKLAEERSKQLVHTERIATAGVLSAGIAHEINNPMTFISSNIQTLDRLWQDMEPLMKNQRQGNKEADKKIDFIIENFPEIIGDMQMGVKRVTNIVKGLKAFCRNSEGKPVPCDINEVIDQSLDMCANALKYHVEVTKDLDDSARQILADSQQISQVLINLFTNAADAIEEKGKGELHISTSCIDKNVRITVSDSGPGIPADKIDDIWQPFFTTKPVDKGTGLGLSISAGIIESHNGTIKVENKTPQTGALFTIELPAITKA